MALLGAVVEVMAWIGGGTEEEPLFEPRERTELIIGDLISTSAAP